MLSSIKKYPKTYQSLKQALLNLEQNTKPSSQIFQIRLDTETGPVQKMDLAASNRKQFNIEISNLPVIGEEAGYILFLIETIAATIIRVSSNTKPISGLPLQIVRQGIPVYKGFTDDRGDVDISDIDLKAGDTVQLDIPLQFIVKESFLRSF